MKTSRDGIQLIQHFEGCRLTAYRCAAGVLTIGWGHTGPDVKAGMVITQERADALMVQDLLAFERDVIGMVKVAMTQSQFDALVAFAFNVGSGALRKSTLLRMLNAGDYSGAAYQFLRWNKAGSVTLRGLTRRRAAERALFLGKPANEAIIAGMAAA